MPTALQDAEHMLASYRHMFNHQLNTTSATTGTTT